MSQVEKQLIDALTSLRNDPEFGASLDTDAIHRRAMERNGFNLSETPVQYTWRDYMETYIWSFTHSMLKPVAMGVAAVIVAVTGSMSMTGAAGQALPGDRLYPMKLSIEKMQLAMTRDSQARASLRVEHASRRLEEMVELAAMLDHTQPETVQLAANRFKTEVVNIQEELTVEAKTQTEFAKTVGRKVEVYGATVATTSTDLPEDVKGEVEEILEETKEQVVEVIISAHESAQDEENARELDMAIEAEMTSIMSEYGDAASEAITLAESLRAEGLYRRAFQVLKDFTFEASLTTEKETEDSTEE